ncbi:MAG: lipopolysaccharide core heptose(I) kinase RfaP [Pseudomonadales bacterium]|nr:lipopolysaccharide core heptose(I) kinase RfaP [Pseudomonadales bacterium]
MPTDCFLREDLRGLLPEEDLLDAAAALEGTVYREVAGRSTRRVELGGRWFFLKFHEGVGVAEMLKSWLSLKQPIVGARNEYEACRYLERVGIVAPRVAAFAESTGPAHRRRSFVLCDELEGYDDLETLTLPWLQVTPGGLERRALVLQVARFARRFHDAGLVHRDFYLCHLLRNRHQPDGPLGVLDLHRALRFEQLPWRWRKRDLAALLYSALDLPLGKCAWLRFVRVYSGRPLAEEFRENGRRWAAVYRRALALYRKGERKGLTAGKFQP